MVEIKHELKSTGWPVMDEILKAFNEVTHESISRWTIYGKVRRIIAALKEADIYQDWMEDYLWLQHDIAEDSI